MAEVAVRAGAEAVGAGGGTIGVRDDARGVLRLSSTVSYSPELVRAYPELPLDAALPICHTARTGDRLLLQDRVSALARFPAAAVHQELTDGNGSRIVAAAVLPLAVPGRLLGSLALTWPEERGFAAEDAELLDALAALVSQALGRVRATVDRDRALARERLLARSAELLRAGLDPGAVLDTTVALVLPGLGDRAWVLLPDGTAHVSSATPQDAAPPADGPVPAHRTGDGPPPAGTDDRGCVSAVRAPLLADGHELGTLVVVRDQGPAHTPEETALVRAVAQRAALALSRALLFAEQRDTSRALQAALLTEAPDADDLQVVVRYRPATGAAVGGDWYNAFQSRDGSTVLVVGDVVGHDAQAAASMGQLRGFLRAVAWVGDEPPAGVLTATEHAARGLSVSVLATAIVARVGPPGDSAAGRVLSWSNAGHPPPVVVHADDTVTVLETDPDLMLGVDSAPARRDHTARLRDGDTLLLYTDGLVERRGADLDDGLRALLAHLRALAGTPPDELCDRLLTLMLRDGAEDDVALLAVRPRVVTGSHPTVAMRRQGGAEHGPRLGAP